MPICRRFCRKHTWPRRTRHPHTGLLRTHWEEVLRSVTARREISQAKWEKCWRLWRKCLLWKWSFCSFSPLETSVTLWSAAGSFSSHCALHPLVNARDKLSLRSDDSDKHKASDNKRGDQQVSEYNNPLFKQCYSGRGGCGGGVRHKTSKLETQPLIRKQRGARGWFHKTCVGRITFFGGGVFSGNNAKWWLTRPEMFLYREGGPIVYYLPP